MFGSANNCVYCALVQLLHCRKEYESLAENVTTVLEGLVQLVEQKMEDSSRSAHLA
jgi:hypothetical protein